MKQTNMCHLIFLLTLLVLVLQKLGTLIKALAIIPQLYP